jgi:putative SOS response-associated peptidase YedK
MCARYALFGLDEAADFFVAEGLRSLDRLYNIAPTDEVPAIKKTSDGKRRLEMFRWGLVPGWAKDPDIGTRLINARAETLAEKPSFRNALKRRRCIVPATGFFEWTGKPGSKQPWFISRRDGKPLAFAGLWEYWEGPAGALQTSTIVTREPNAFMKQFHNRMPAMLLDPELSAWLEPETPASAALKMLKPVPDHLLQAVPVDPRMSNPGWKEPEAVAARGETHTS